MRVPLAEIVETGIVVTRSGKELLKLGLVVAWVAPALGSSLARYAHLPIMPLVLLAVFWACWLRLRRVSPA